MLINATYYPTTTTTSGSPPVHTTTTSTTATPALYDTDNNTYFTQSTGSTAAGQTGPRINVYTSGFGDPAGGLAYIPDPQGTVWMNMMAAAVSSAQLPTVNVHMIGDVEVDVVSEPTP